VEARRLLSQWINVQDEAAEIAKKKGIQTSWPDGKVQGLSSNRASSQERTTSEVFESARAAIGATSSSSSSSGNYVSASRNRASEIRSSLDTGLRSSRDALRSSRDAFTPNNLRTSTENFKNNLRSSHEKHEKRGWKTGDLGWKPTMEERENDNNHNVGGIREFKQEFDKDHYDREHLLEEVERSKNKEEVKFPPRWSSSVFPDEELGDGGNNNSNNVGQGLQVNGTGSGSSSSSSGSGSSSSSSRAGASSKSSGKTGSVTSSSSKLGASRDKKTSQKSGGPGAQKGPQKSSSPTATGLYIGNPTLIKNSIQNKKKTSEEEIKKPNIDPNDVDLKRISGATASSCLRKKETVVFNRVRDKKKLFREEDSPRAFVPGAKKTGKSGKDGQSEDLGDGV
jgi:hypothetical protein